MARDMKSVEEMDEVMLEAIARRMSPEQIEAERKRKEELEKQKGK